MDIVWGDLLISIEMDLQVAADGYHTHQSVHQALMEQSFIMVTPFQTAWHDFISTPCLNCAIDMPPVQQEN